MFIKVCLRFLPRHAHDHGALFTAINGRFDRLGKSEGSLMSLAVILPCDTLASGTYKSERMERAAKISRSTLLSNHSPEQRPS